MDKVIVLSNKKKQMSDTHNVDEYQKLYGNQRNPDIRVPTI